MSGWKVPSKFSEIILADVFTSFAKALADWDALLWCHLLTPLYLPAPIQTASGVQCGPSLFSVVLVCLPYYLRFKQCISDYRETRMKRHLWNALKYLSSFPTIYISHMITAGRRDLELFWFLAFTVNFIFSLAWDVLVDWDLGGAGLRSHLLFPKHAYVIAIIFNALIRGLWIFRIHFIVSNSRNISTFMDSDLGGVLLQILEIMRRAIWLVFRAETQALTLVKSPVSASPFVVVDETTELL